MSTSVTMPALGESVTEGTVTRWLKQEGDQVDADEPLLEVSTDKVDTEIPSPPPACCTKIVVGEDETVAVGAELAVIGDGGDGGGGGARRPSRPQQAPQPRQPSSRGRSSRQPRRSRPRSRAAAAAAAEAAPAAGGAAAPAAVRRRSAAARR